MSQRGPPAAGYGSAVGGFYFHLPAVIWSALDMAKMNATQQAVFNNIKDKAKGDASFGVTGWLMAIEQAIVGQGRQLIDTPEERKGVEDVAIAAFNDLVAQNIPPMILSVLDGFLTKMLDKLLVSLATSKPKPAPTTPPPPPAAQ